MDASQVRGWFADRFGRPAELVARAPGRVNLIGDHTDYNDGFVLPMALQHQTWAAVAARDDGRLRAFSRDLGEAGEWPLDGWTPAVAPRWTAYVAGVAALLVRRGAHLRGADLLIASQVPIAAGLSSSAALEVAVAVALANLAGEPLEASELIDLCRQAEHEFAGVPCGAMDQTVALLARRGHALLLDCRTRQAEHVPVQLEGCEFLVVHCGARRDLAASAYARRQAECAQAVQYFRGVNPAVRALRDVSADTVRAHASQMDPVAAARSLHVVSENARTLQAAAALRRRDAVAVGELMTASHRSLRDDFEVSSGELDRLVARLLDVRGVLGARLTGGGFGGCVLALLEKTAVTQAARTIEEHREKEFPGAAVLFAAEPGPGAAVE